MASKRKSTAEASTALPAVDDSTSAKTVEVPVLDCDLCPALCSSRSKIVNGRGNTSATILIVGEAPGQQEDQLGKPFAGESGKLLARLLSEAGISPLEVYLTNAVRCRPAGNRTPTAKEIAACRAYLIEEIRRVNPRVIITVGGTALKPVYS